MTDTMASIMIEIPTAILGAVVSVMGVGTVTFLAWVVKKILEAHQELARIERDRLKADSENKVLIVQLQAQQNEHAKILSEITKHVLRESPIPHTERIPYA